jgi:hypothetical protein
MGIRCFMVEPVDRQGGRWRRIDTGEEFAYLDMPPGAIWEASWMAQPINGTGPTLVVKLPNGNEWMPGSRARNCGRPGEDHDCWCVHGDAPALTVDKTPAPGRTTCEAGAGSIGSGEPGTDRYWHGFLRGGELVD